MINVKEILGTPYKIFHEEHKTTAENLMRKVQKLVEEVLKEAVNNATTRGGGPDSGYDDDRQWVDEQSILDVAKQVKYE